MSRVSFVRAAKGGYEAMLGLEQFINAGPVPQATLELLRLRVSQINGCGFCVDMHARDARAAGESEQRLFAVSAWRDTPFFTAEERAALALAEAVTRIADKPDPVPDAVWDDAAAHYDEESLSVLLYAIASINAWNRLSVATHNAPQPR